MGNESSVEQRTSRSQSTGIINLSDCRLASLPKSLSQRLCEPGSTLAPLIKSVDLSRNNLKLIPIEVRELRQLKRLVLGRNSIATISSDSLRNMPALELLDLQHNCIATIDNSAFDILSSLKTLDLSNNKILQLPLSLDSLVNLISLDVSNNSLTAIPATCWNAIRCLEIVNLEDNKIEIIPSELSLCTKLTTLKLANNRISAFPSEIFHIQSLTTLTLWEGNMITSHAVMAMSGYEEFDSRRKGRVDQLVKLN